MVKSVEGRNRDRGKWTSIRQGAYCIVLGTGRHCVWWVGGKKKVFRCVMRSFIHSHGAPSPTRAAHVALNFAILLLS